ncbi:MAG TPA: crossover junction endodeoxyribonuclease RuvC [Bryobacteraceae bacterium]|nr:crossover junction endodeoxyribonuclease RuvC [Bryobacteraceae bacterium]
MRVLGIDCGTERTGWGVIDSDGRRHTVVSHGVIRTSSAKPLAERLSAIGREVRALLSANSLDAAAVEEVFFSLNVKTALKLAHVRGVVLAAIADAGVALGEYSPLEVKTSVVGYGRAEKSQVQLMVRTLTGLRGVIETEDASDALAVAICHATTCARAVPVPRARKVAGAGR